MARAFLLTVALVGCGRLDFDAQPRTDDAPPDATPGPRIVDVAVGGAHTCMLDDASRVKCWGHNEWGVLGAGTNDLTFRGLAPGEPGSLPSVDLGAVEVRGLSTRADYTCALTQSGVTCWGNNDGSQLGNGTFDHIGDEPDEMGRNLVVVPLTSAPDLQQVVTSHYHTCVRSLDGTRCWGLNDLEQLGRGNTQPLFETEDLRTLAPVDLGAFVPAELAGQFNGTCARDAQGRVKCWGYNPDGVLGLGDTDSRGGDPNDMGDNLPVVDLGPGFVATQLAAGWTHTCALSDLGLKCWGGNDEGQLGLDDRNDRGDVDGEMGTALSFVNVGRATAIAAGEHTTYAIVDGEVLAWGLGRYGALGNGSTENLGDDAGEITPDLPRVPLPARALRVWAGAGHACALLETGAAACWGRNTEGQVGAGRPGDVGDEPGESPVVHTVSSLWP